MSFPKLLTAAAYSVLGAFYIYRLWVVFTTYPGGATGTLAGLITHGMMLITVFGIVSSWLWARRSDSSKLLLAGMIVPALLALALYVFTQGLAGI